MRFPLHVLFAVRVPGVIVVKAEGVGWGDFDLHFPPPVPRLISVDAASFSYFCAATFLSYLSFLPWSALYEHG